MTCFLRFRRFAFLLLSLTLSVQAMAVASLGACHRMKALSSVIAVAAHGTQHAITKYEATQAPRNPAHEMHHGSSAQHDSVQAGASLNHSHGDSQNDGDRVKCASCAGCVLSCAVLPDAAFAVNIPAASVTKFLESTLPRVDNIANGLERPPRA